MRARYALPFGIMIVLGCTILLVEAERGNSAPQGKKSFKFDPTKIFEKMAKGTSTLTISEQQWGKEELEFFAKENGITNGKLTKDQYLKYWDQKEEIRKKLGIDPFAKRSKGTDNKKPEADKKPETADADPKKKEAADEKDLDADAEKSFNRFDTNSDGFLNADEISKTSRFKLEWEKWDENKDKLISLSEWKAYFKDFQAQRQKEREKRAADAKNGKKIIMEEDDDEERIVVYRLGKLPAGIPDWFTELDLDKDGQVSLFEWNKAGKDIEEFQKMDRNDDGFLTAEEVMRFQRLAAESQQRTIQVASTINGSNPRDQKTEEPKFKGKGNFKKKNRPEK